MFFKKSFNPVKCKTLLKLTTSRLKLLKNRREVQLKQMKRELAKLLETNQEPSAHIRVELIYRELNIIAAYEIIELLCELLASRIPIIVSQKQCPIELKEAVGSIIYAAPRCSDVPELQKIRSLFTAKYGKEFTAIAAELRQDCGVNRVVVEKLSTKGPSLEVRLKVMKEIAIEQGLDWSPKALESQNITAAPEELLDGPSRFFSASQTSMQKSFKKVSDTEPLSPLKESFVAEAKTHVAQNNEFTNGEQFIPFVRPSVEDDSASSGSSSNSRMRSMQQQSSSSNYSTQGISTTYSSHRLSVTPSHKDDVDSQRSFKRRASFKGAANAALAAAESAEQAAAAARAAAHLASRTVERSIEETTSSDSESNDSDAELYLHDRFEDEHLRAPANDSSTSRMPLFDEPAEEREFNKMDSTGKAWSSYGKLREEPTMVLTDRYNFGETDSPAHDMMGQGRRVDEKTSRQRQNSNLTFFSNLHYRRDYTRARSFQSAGAAPSFDTYEWDEQSRAKPADETPQSGPPARPPPQPLSRPQGRNLTKSTSFVHPKLPDYDNLAAHFQALKAMRSGK